MKILVVFTGGTIGCVRKGEVLSPDNEQKYMLTQMYLDSRQAGSCDSPQDFR